jgi:HPt (histidine-containing phosphotransfer) domain-containing protein
LLRLFLAELPSNLEKLRGQAGAGRLQEAAATLHTLQGLAGMLGAGALAQACGEAEAAARQASSDAPAPAGLLDAVESAAAPLREGGSALVALLTEGAEGADTPTTGRAGGLAAAASEEDRGLVRELLARLEASDMQALGILERLLPRRQALGESLLAPLEAAVERLDFDVAARLCRQWLGEAAP